MNCPNCNSPLINAGWDTNTQTDLRKKRCRKCRKVFTRKDMQTEEDKAESLKRKESRG